MNCLKRINCLIKCYYLFTLYADNVYFSRQLSDSSTFTPIRQDVIVINAEDLRRDIHGFQTGCRILQMRLKFLRPH